MRLVTYWLRNSEVTDAPLFGAVRNQEVIRLCDASRHMTEGLESIEAYPFRPVMMREVLQLLAGNC